VKALIVICSGIFAATLAFVLNWFALIPWRKSKHQHWSEQARLYYPVRTAAASNLWVLPAVLTISIVLVWPEQSPHWMLLATVTSFAVVVGTIPMDREVFPRITRRELLRQVTIAWVMRVLQWFVFLSAIVLSPDEFNLECVMILAVVILLCIFWTHSGWIFIGRTLGLFSSPPARLLKIVQETAARTKVQVGHVFLMRTAAAAAYAIPNGAKLLFTRRFLELLSDDEISAVTAHELAHLTETRADHYKRHVIWLIFLPWVLFNPVIHTLGPMGFFILAAVTIAAPVLFKSVSRQLETRADQMARAHEPAPGIYALALLKLYRDQLAPAVNPKQQLTHPDLYDRLLSAGLEPDFPRPMPAQAMAWSGHVCSVALGIIGMLLVIRMTAG
jgi:Zn-dependent protease with chaperone function